MDALGLVVYFNGTEMDFALDGPHTVGTITLEEARRWRQEFPASDGWRQVAYWDFGGPSEQKL